MFIGSRQHHRQGRTALIYQDVDFAAAFAPIGGVLPGLLTAERRGTAFTVNRLPFPLDFPLLGVELNHDPHDLSEDALALPGLEAFVQGTAAHAKPPFVYRFPLTPCPQHIPDAIQDRAIIGGWSSRTALLRRFGQDFLDLAPQGARHLKVIDVFRFWGRVFTHVASRFRWVGRTPNSGRDACFFHPRFNLWIDTKL